MHQPRHSAVRVCLVLALSALAAVSAQANERTLDGVNFTGPLITPNPAGMPAGHWYVEPYLVRVDSSSSFDHNGDRHRISERSGA